MSPIARRDKKQGESSPAGEFEPDPERPSEELDALERVGDEAVTHSNDRRTVRGRRVAHVDQLHASWTQERRGRVALAYTAHDAYLLPARSRACFGMAPEGQDARQWLAELERLLMDRQKSPAAELRTLTDRDAEVRTAYLLGIRDAVAEVERLEHNRVDRDGVARSKGGAANRGLRGWLPMLLSALWRDQEAVPRDWNTVRQWIEGAHRADPRGRRAPENRKPQPARAITLHAAWYLLG